MARKERQQIGSFYTATADGERGFRVLHFQDYHVSGSRRVAGLKELQTDDGQAVNYLSSGKYHHVGLGLDLFSNDPGAP